MGGSTTPQETAERLIGEFGSLNAILAGGALRLRQAAAGDDLALAAITWFRDAVSFTNRERVAARPLLDCWSAAMAWLRADLAWRQTESMRMLYLDTRLHLIVDDVAHGSVDSAPVYGREIVVRALEVGASNLLLAHNHPSRDPSPSRTDIDLTRQLGRQAALFGIVLHDHIIFGGDKHFSLKSHGLLAGSIVT